MQQNLQVQVIECPSCKNISIALDPAKIMSGCGLHCQACGWVMGSVMPAGIGKTDCLGTAAIQSFTRNGNSQKAG